MVRSAKITHAMVSIALWMMILFVVVLCTSCPVEIQASFYYVSPSGDDADEGSFGKPWRTLSKASAVAEAGDTVFIRGGTYNERLIPANGGTSESPIIFASYPGETAIIDGTGVDVDNWWGIVHIVSKNYVEIRNIRVQNSEGMGIFTEGSTGVVIDGCTTVDTFVSGILCNTCTGIKITNNTVIRGAQQDNGSEQPATTCQECISVQETSDATIAFNTIHDGMNEGIDLKGGCSNCKVHDNHVYRQSHCGIYIGEWDKHDRDIEVFNNTVHDCPGGVYVAVEYGGTCKNISVYDNLAYHNTQAGFTVAGWGLASVTHDLDTISFYRNISTGNGSGFNIAGTTNSELRNINIYNNILSGNLWMGICLWGPGPGTTETTMHDVHIVNNTIVDNGISLEWGSGGITGWNFIAENLIIRNNILYGNANAAIAVPSGMTGLVIDHNGIDAVGVTPAFGPNLTPGSNVVALDPAPDESPFQDEKTGDYRPISDSEIIDTGSALNAPETDFSGVVRPQGLGIDLGAYELSS